MVFGIEEEKIKIEGGFDTTLNNKNIWEKLWNNLHNNFLKGRVMGEELSALKEEGWHVCNWTTEYLWHCLLWDLPLTQEQTSEKQNWAELCANTVCFPVTEISTIRWSLSKPEFLIRVERKVWDLHWNGKFSLLTGRPRGPLSPFWPGSPFNPLTPFNPGSP